VGLRLVWTRWQREKFPSPAGFRNPVVQQGILVYILTELSRPSKCYKVSYINAHFKLDYALSYVITVA
jgi:hypothetical protein